MTFFWDTHWCFAVGIIAATYGPTALAGDRAKKMVHSFVAGLAVSMLLMIGSFWLYVEVDADWMLNYFLKPGAGALALGLALYPVCYTAGFLVTMELCRAKMDRWWMLIFSLWWAAFTVILIPRFYLVYGTTSNPEWFWEVSRTTDNLFFIPIPEMSLGYLFMFFFAASITMHGMMICIGLVFAKEKRDCLVPNLARENPYCCVDL